MERERAAASLSAALAIAIACIIHVACTDPPTADGAGAATTACSPLVEPGATVTAEGLTADGHYVVVVTSASAPGPRVFFGVSSHMVEGVLTAQHQTCALEVDFDVQGRSEVATFSPGPPACAVASTLTSGNAGDAMVQVTLDVVVPAGSSDAGADADADAGAGSAPVAAMPASSLMFFCL